MRPGWTEAFNTANPSNGGESSAVIRRRATAALRSRPESVVPEIAESLDKPKVAKSVVKSMSAQAKETMADAIESAEEEPTPGESPQIRAASRYLREVERYQRIWRRQGELSDALNQEVVGGSGYVPEPLTDEQERQTVVEEIKAARSILRDMAKAQPEPARVRRSRTPTTCSTCSRRRTPTGASSPP